MRSWIWNPSTHALKKEAKANKQKQNKQTKVSLERCWQAPQVPWETLSKKIRKKRDPPRPPWCSWEMTPGHHTFLCMLVKIHTYSHTRSIKSWLLWICNENQRLVTTLATYTDGLLGQGTLWIVFPFWSQNLLSYWLLNSVLWIRW